MKFNILKYYFKLLDNKNIAVPGCYPTSILIPLLSILKDGLLLDEYKLFKLDKLQILLMNVEALSTRKGLDFAHQFLNVKKALFAVDELTGFIFAVTYVRPSKSIFEVKPKSVKKKLKQKSFAASVVREDIFLSVEELEIDLTEHIQFVIDALAEKAEILGLAGD